MKRHTELAVWSAVLIAAVPAVGVQGQTGCDPQWLPGPGVPGVYGEVNALALWDPDGAGPLGARLAAGGNFTVAGMVPAQGLAWQDLSTQAWTTVGTGITGVSGSSDIEALAGLPDGRLAIGGSFTSIGGVMAQNIAVWDGSSFAPLGAGLSPVPGYPAYVTSLAVLPAGGLLAGGSFATSGGQDLNNIGVWDGTVWQHMNYGFFTAGSVHAVGVLPDGSPVAAGSITLPNIGSVNVARWNGSSWEPVGSGVPGTVKSLAVEADGTMAVRLDDRVYRWDGTVWTQVGPTYLHVSADNGRDGAICVLPGGDIVVGGGRMQVPPGSAVRQGLMRWDGAAWVTWGAGVQATSSPRVHALFKTPDGDMYAGGSFAAISGVGADSIARLSGAQWSALGQGMNTGDGNGRTGVFAVQPLTGGRFVVGGDFYSAGAATGANSVALWNGSAFEPLGTGVSGGTGAVEALAVLANGDIVAAGNFTTAGGVPASNIARWNGTAWSPMGDGFNSTVYALLALPNGDVVAGGMFTATGGTTINRIARWNGSAWATLGTGVNGSVFALLLLPNGDVVAGGGFATAGGVSRPRVARWDGTSWFGLGTGTGPGAVSSMCSLPSGDIVVGGNITSAGGVPAYGVARWNGASWNALGTTLDTSVSMVGVAPDGSVLVWGYVSVPGPSLYNGRIARWDGSAWSSFSEDIVRCCMNSAVIPGTIEVMATLSDGDFVIGGAFMAVGNELSRHIARFGVSDNCHVCDPIDFNGDGLFPDTQDIDDFLSVFSGGPCSTGTCGDIDFNNDGLFPDTLDIDSLLSVFSGGACL